MVFERCLLNTTSNYNLWLHMNREVYLVDLALLLTTFSPISWSCEQHLDWSRHLGGDGLPMARGDTHYILHEYSKDCCLQKQQHSIIIKKYHKCFNSLVQCRGLFLEYRVFQEREDTHALQQQRRVALAIPIYKQLTSKGVHLFIFPSD